jgi:hypothetical protein
VQATGNDVANRRFAGTHRADEDDVAVVHAAMITET